MKKILIVDDQKGIRLLLNEVFSREGYKIFQAANGLEALKIMASNNIDCVLLDMKIRNEWDRNITRNKKE